MAFYECTFIARQDLAPSDVKKLTEERVALLEKHGAKVMKQENWGIRTLAYEINKNRKGHYVFLGVEAKEEALEAYRNEQRLSEEVVRNVEIFVEEMDANKPTVMMRDEAA
jgi:small subunit ribosomal protein S6